MRELRRRTDIGSVTTGSSGIAGAAIGGLDGNEIDKGTGKDPASAAAAVGGTIAGHEIDQNRSAKDKR